MSDDTGLDWSALLQKTEQKITKLENFYDSNDPLTEIDKVRGVEHAYYEKEMQECSDLISRMEEEGNGIEDKRHTSPVQGSRDAPVDIPEENMSPRARRLYQQFGGDKKEVSGKCPSCGSNDVNLLDAEGIEWECNQCGNKDMATKFKNEDEEEIKRLEEEITGLGGLLES